MEMSEQPFAQRRLFGWQLERALEVFVQIGVGIQLLIDDILGLIALTIVTSLLYRQAFV